MLRHVMTAHASWRKAVRFSVFLDQRISRPRKRFSQEARFVSEGLRLPALIFRPPRQGQGRRAWPAL